MARSFGMSLSTSFLVLLISWSCLIFSSSANPVSPTESSSVVTANPSCNQTGYCRIPDTTLRADDWTPFGISNRHICSSLFRYTSAQLQAANLGHQDLVNFLNFHHRLPGSLDRMPGYGLAQDHLFQTKPCYYDQHRLPPVYYDYKCTSDLVYGCSGPLGQDYTCKEITRTVQALRRLKPPTDCDSTETCLRSDGVEMGTRCCQWAWAEEQRGTGVACVKDVPSKEAIRSSRENFEGIRRC